MEVLEWRSLTLELGSQDHVRVSDIPWTEHNQSKLEKPVLGNSVVQEFEPNCNQSCSSGWPNLPDPQWGLHPAGSLLSVSAAAGRTLPVVVPAPLVFSGKWIFQGTQFVSLASPLLGTGILLVILHSTYLLKVEIIIGMSTWQSVKMFICHSGNLQILLIADQNL